MTLFCAQLELVLRGLTQAECVELQRLAELDEPDGPERRGTALANARRVLGARVREWFLPLRPAG